MNTFTKIPEIMKIYNEYGDKIETKKYVFDKTIKHTIEEDEEKTNIIFNGFDLKEHELDVYNLIKINKYNCFVIVAPTGSGKTLLAKYLSKDHKTLVIVHNNSIKEEWKNDTMCIESFVKKYDKLSEYNCIIFDELHKYLSKVYLKAVVGCNAKLIIGLTATPVQKFGMFPYNLFQSIVFVEPCKEPLYKLVLYKLETNIDLYSNQSTKKVRGTEELDYQALHEKIETNDRIDFIVENLNKILEQNNMHVICFFKHKHMIEYFLEHTFFNSVVYELHGSQSDDIIKHDNKNTVICATYSYANTGIDIKHLNTLVIIEPVKNNFKQVLGRILREPGKKYVIDVVDNHPVFENHFKHRMDEYKQYL